MSFTQMQHLESDFSSCCNIRRLNSIVCEEDINCMFFYQEPDLQKC